MKALTIMEPWAWCIIDLSQQSDGWKCVENRHAQFPRFTGPLLIHSGRGTAWLKDEETIADSVCNWTGCTLPVCNRLLGRGIIGGVHVVANCPLTELGCQFNRGSNFDQYARLWAAGPRCLLLARPFVFPQPVPARGAQGLWNVPDDLLFDALDNETWREFKEWRGDR